MAQTDANIKTYAFTDLYSGMFQGYGYGADEVAAAKDMEHNENLREVHLYDYTSERSTPQEGYAAWCVDEVNAEWWAETDVQGILGDPDVFVTVEVLNSER